MRTRRLTCLITLFFFSFAVLVRTPLVAAERARVSALARAESFLFEDREQSSGGRRRLGELVARDFARARAGVSALRARLASVKLSASAGDRSGRLRDLLQRLRGRLADRLDATIDQMGLQAFCATIEKVSGAPVAAGAEGMDERLVRARLVRAFDESFEVVAGEMELAGPQAVVAAVREAEGVVDQMAGGATPEQVVETLRARHFGPAGSETARRGPGFFKAVTTVLRTLFMVAACGAISLVSLGVLSYGLASGGLVFVAAGGAAVVACLYGVVFYVAECIKRFRRPGPRHAPAPAFAFEVAR